MAKRELEAVIFAAQKLGNVAYNVAQRGRIPDNVCESARDAVREFDNALRVYRVATKPKKREPKAIKRQAKRKKGG